MIADSNGMPILQPLADDADIATFNAAFAMIGTQLNSVAPPLGSVIFGTWNAAPATGWLLANGLAVSRTTYSALFGLIGTTYGSGDGSTTFTLPNLAGRIPIGYDGTQSEFNAMGKTGGSKTHTHPLSDAGAAKLYFDATHTWVQPTGLPDSPSWNGLNSSGGTVGWDGTTSTNHQAGIGLIGSTDGGSTLPAYVVLRAAIRAL